MNCNPRVNASPAPPRLSIRLLGEWEFMLDGAPLKGRLYGKAVALAAYLSIEQDRSHAREHLASLLWPNLTAESARGNLRQALRRLRDALGPSAPEFLAVTRDTLRFHAAHPDCRVDVAVLTEPFPGCGHGPGPDSSAVCAQCLGGLESRLAVYRGEFLAGLALSDAPEFELWLDARRQSLRGRAFLLAERLCSACEAAGKPDLALAYAQRCMELEPWNEAAHRRHMRLLADQRQYATAQVHYDAYRAGLAQDFSSDPAASTHALFEAIHKSGLAAGRPGASAAQESPPPAKAERRQVTILCCHLDLPPGVQGDCTEQLAEARSVCTVVLRRHAGHIAQGHDGYLYAYLGYPTAQEQAGRQAVLAALELSSLFGPPYRFRAGIHTGVIVTGFDPFIPDIIGSASGTAWRLCRRLRKSGIVVSDATAHLLHGRFPLHALERLDAGRKAGTASAGPPAHLLLAREDGDASPRAAAPAAPALIGRRAELQRLKKLWRLASRGEPQFLVLRGEAGIGKTRLAGSLRDEAARRPAGVRHLHCYPEHRHTPLYPVIALFESILGLSADDTPAAQRRKLQDYLRRQHPAVADAAEPVLMLLLSIAPADAPVPSPQQRKQQTLDMMLLLLDSIASTRPLLLIIEDAQWLDVTTRDLLERLLHRKRPAALLTLVTARPDFDPAWLKAEAVLELQPLRDAEIARLARATVGSLSSRAIDSIVRRADGIPFYAEQMARISSGAPDEGGGIPAILRDLLLTRLDSVPQARRILQLAATIGRRFEQSLLERISALQAPALEPVLRRLVDAHLISAVAAPDAAFQFRHALIQEAAYDSQIQADRREAHRRVADALSRRHPQRAAQQPAEIAHHYTCAGDPAAAIRWWLSAGRQALRVSATAEADKHLREGLNLLDQLPRGEERDSQEAALLLSLGQAVQLGRGYGSQDAARIYDRAFELSHERLPLKQRFEILWGLWTVSSSRPGYGFPQARELARELLELATHGADRELLAKAHTANANVALWLDRPAEACRHARAGAEAGDHLQNTMGGLDPAVACLAYQSWAHWKQHRTSDALAASRRSLARARSLDDPDSLCAALGFAAMLERFLGNIQAVADHTRELQSVADLYQLATWQGLGRMLQAWMRVRQGDEGGIAVLQACAQGIQQIMPSVAAIFLHALAEAYGFLHRYDEQSQAIADGLQAAAKVDERFFGSMLERMRRVCPAVREARRLME